MFISRWWCGIIRLEMLLCIRFILKILWYLYGKIEELPTGLGIADVVFIPPNFRKQPVLNRLSKKLFDFLHNRYVSIKYLLIGG